MKNYLLAVIFLSFLHTVSAATLNLFFYTECYYIGSGQMQPVLLNGNACSTCYTQTDTFVVELHDKVVPATIIASFKGILFTYGAMPCTFPNSVIGTDYYIAVKHRNTVQTWSANPVMMSATTTYNFSTAASQAYGNNMILVDTSPDIWAFYCGDITQDGNVDQIDDVSLDYGINHGLFGYYSADLNGDGNVDLLDFPILDSNICYGIYTHHP